MASQGNLLRPFAGRLAPAGAISIALLGAACEGTLGGQKAPDVGLAPDAHSDSTTLPGEEGRPTLQTTILDACDELGAGLHPGDAPIRRLTHSEYNATVRDLLGSQLTPADEFPNEARALGFNGIAEAQNVSVLHAEAYQLAAKALADEATADVSGLLGCDPGTEGCVAAAITELGGLAYRRPLRQDELASLMTLYDWGNESEGPREGMKMVLEVILQSPDFLYRPEFGDEVVEEGVVRLSSFEMATRLSYLLTGSMPDTELRAAAERNELVTGAQITAQAQRLLAQEEAHEIFLSFFSQWLDLEAVTHIERDPAVYPGYSEEIPALLMREVEEFVEYVLFEDDGRYETLLTAPYSLLNAELAAFYGVEPPSGGEFGPVDMPGRGGLLSLGGLQAHHAQPLSTSPVHRGKFVRESILCQNLAPPPDDLIVTPPDLDPGLSTRERYAAHSEEPACAGCHRLMDPIGLGFEGIDPVGRIREHENGIVVDTTGELVELDVVGPFDGPVELAAMLASSEEVSACMTKNWFRFGYGKSESPADACSLEDLWEQFSESGGHIPSLLLSLTQTDAFLYRKVVTP